MQTLTTAAQATVTLPPEAVAQIAEQVAAILEERLAAKADPSWLDASQAAAHICAPISRVRKLTMTGELPHEKDGRRVLYNRDELDRFIREGGAKTP